MITLSENRELATEGLVEFRRRFNKQIEVVAASMLFPQSVFVGSLVPFALHRAEQIAVIDDRSIVLDSLLKMLPL
jgi:hypothetical protein